VCFVLVSLVGSMMTDPLVIRVMDSFFGISYLAVTLHSELCNFVMYVMQFSFDRCGKKKVPQEIYIFVKHVVDIYLFRS